MFWNKRKDIDIDLTIRDERLRSLEKDLSGIIDTHCRGPYGASASEVAIEILKWDLEEVMRILEDYKNVRDGYK